MAKVIQADRDAAVAYLNAIESESGVTVRSVSGNHPLLKAFAAHREASTAKLEADMAVLVEALHNWACRSCDGDGFVLPMVNGRSRIEKCLTCDGTGNHPTAREALTRIQGEYRSGEVADE